jgi:hypothetical protein
MAAFCNPAMKQREPAPAALAPGPQPDRLARARDLITEAAYRFNLNMGESLRQFPAQTRNHQIDACGIDIFLF